MFFQSEGSGVCIHYDQRYSTIPFVPVSCFETPLSVEEACCVGKSKDVSAHGVEFILKALRTAVTEYDIPLNRSIKPMRLSLSRSSPASP